MGLDNFWKIPEGEHHPVFTGIDFEIVGGMLSGSTPLDLQHTQCKSFRGKVYSNFIDELTGISLYSDLLDQEEITHIARALKNLRQTLDGKKPIEKLRYLGSKFEGCEMDSLTSGLLNLPSLEVMFQKYSEIDGVCLESWF